MFRLTDIATLQEPWVKLFLDTELRSTSARGRGYLQRHQCPRFILPASTILKPESPRRE
jgi:hypothetical protein